MSRLDTIDIRTKDGLAGLLFAQYADRRIVSAIEDIGRAVDNPRRFELIKDDASATVGVLSNGGLPFGLMVKRFNYRGRGRAIARRLTGSKARRLFETTLRLHERGLPVPEPVGYLEGRDGRVSIYLSMYMEGFENFVTAYRAGAFTDTAALARTLGRVVACFHAAGAVHGDLKWSNLLVTRDGDVLSFVFVDLDRAELHQRPSMKGITRDLVRFYRYGLELGASEWVSREFFPAYISSAGPGISIDAAAIRNLAEKEFAGKAGAL